jgi:L-asparaginase
MISQARCNSVNLGLYEAGAEAARLGVISGGDMTPEAAVVKLMHVLAHVKGLPAIRDAMERDLAGERS